MGLIELLIIILLLVWAFGYFGRGRLYGGGGSDVALGGSNLIHTLLVIVVILVILRLLRVL